MSITSSKTGSAPVYKSTDLHLCILTLLTLALLACTPRMYGVPLAQWETMTDSQRKTAIQGYNERMKIEAERRLAESRRAAEDAERTRIEAERIAEAENKHIAAIYEGNAGIYGDLVRVTVREGSIFLHGKHRPYQPVSFLIADGERKPIRFDGIDKHAYKYTTLINYFFSCNNR